MKKEVYGSLVWLIVTLFVVYSFCLNTAAAVFFDSVKTTLHAGNVQATLAVSAFILGFACMQIPAGYLLDKYNARFVVSSGVLILALGNIIISFANNIFVFTLANLLQGIGASFAFIAAAVIISQWFKPKIFPILFGLTQALSCILSAIIHYYFTVVLATQSWNSIYQKLAIFGLGLFILTILLVKSPVNYARAAGISLKKSLVIVMQNKQVLLCTLAAAMSFGVLLAYASLWYLPVQKNYSVNHLEALVISGMIFVGIGIGTPILGWISNLVKSRIMILHLTLVLGTMALLLGIYLPHYNINTYIIIKIVSFLIGFLLSGSMLFYTVVSEISSDKTRGVALSITNTGVFLFNTLLLFIPLLFITAASTVFFTYLWVLPFFAMLSILLLYFIKESYSR
jgi:MFS family permease